MALKAQFRARGFYRKPTGRILFQLGLHILTASAGLLLLLLLDGFWVAALGMAVFSAGEVGLATNTHTSAHQATSRRRWLNHALTYFGYPLILGMGATYWWTKHNVLHHSAPNVIGVDDDIQFKPWFAFSQADVRAGGRRARAYYRFQWVLMLPIALLISFQMQLWSVLHLLRVMRSKRGWAAAHWVDAAVLAIHWLCWVGVPLLVLPAWSVLGFTVMRLAIMSIILFVVFAPAHIPAEASAVYPEGRGEDPFLLQSSNTLNFRAGPLGAWLISGLQHQIEHHLFPGISHVHYPAMSPLVAEYCRRNGYPYRTLGWGEALVKTVGNFVHPKEVTPELRRIA